MARALSAGLLAVIATSCSSAASAYQETRQLDTLEAYEQFIRDYENGPEVQGAIARRAELLYARAEKLDEIDGYRKFLKEVPRGPLATRAKERCVEIEYAAATRDGSERALQSFVARHQGHALAAQAAQRVAELQAQARARDDDAFQEATGIGTIDALTRYLRDYPAGVHSAEAKRSLDRLHAEQARAQERQEIADLESTPRDDAIVAWLRAHPRADADLVRRLGLLLKDRVLMRGPCTLPSERLPRTWVGGARSGNDEYPCGVDLAAFDRRVDERYDGVSLIVGPRRYFKNGAGYLNFTVWTSFDGHLALGEATVHIGGLRFATGSFLISPK